MGFFGNNVGIANKTKVEFAKSVVRFINTCDPNSFGFLQDNYLKITTMSPKPWSPQGRGRKPWSEDLLKDITEKDIEKGLYINDFNYDALFHIEDNFTVTFLRPIILHKISAKDIPFTLSNSDQPGANAVVLQQVKDDVFDWLPEEVGGLWINNAYRTNKTLSFKNVKKVRSIFAITGMSQCESLEGLEDIEVGGSVEIRNCKKLTSTKGCPKANMNNSNNAAISISGCPSLTTIDFSKDMNRVNIFINDKTCPIKTVTSLPKEVGYFGCKTIDFEALKNIDSKIDFVETANYKGKGDAEIVTKSNSLSDIKKGIKDIIDPLIQKRWQLFDDLLTVVEYFGMLDYWNDNSTRYKYSKEEADHYIENGMIHSYDPVGETVQYSYYGYGVTRNNIKKGVCNYLNKLGVRYHIINDDPKKKKENEFIKIEL